MAACLVAAMVGSGAAAQEPNPEPLWNAYALDEDQGASASGGQNAATTTQAPVTVTEAAGDGPPWVLMIAAAAGGALFVVVLLTLQGRWARHREAALVGVTDEWPWLTAKASGDVGELRVERPRTAPGMPTTNGVAPERAEEEGPERAAQAEPAGDEAPVEPDFDVVEAGAAPPRRFDREEGSSGRAVSARRGPICQVRWSSGGMCFYAVTADADGVEQRVAWSPPIEWDDAGPPDEDSRQARAALRVISKDLRDKGWRPMRAKGSDFDEQRWYARRFRFPVAEGEDAREAVARARGGS